jgi:hypothetical protein
MNIKILKANRKSSFDRIRTAIEEELYSVREKPSQRRLLNRLEESLIEVGRSDLFKRIQSCSLGQRCGSLWCPACRSHASQASANKISERINQKKYNNSDLVHVTAPVGLAYFDVNDVNRTLSEDNLRWKRIRKKHSFWIEATYEFELVNIQFLLSSKGSDLKKIQMKQMIEHHGIKDREFIFVHWHGVTDLNKDQVENTFGKEYFVGGDRLHKTSPSGLYVQSLHESRTLEENVRKVSSYPFKSVYRFKHSFSGSDYSNGEYLTLNELGRLVLLYNDIQGRQWRRLRRHCGTIS